MRIERTTRKFPMPSWPTFGKAGWCKWCGKTIPTIIDGKKSTQRMWHPACVYEFELHTRQPDQLAYLIKRDGKRCRCCPEGAPIPKRWINKGLVTIWQPRPSFGNIAEIGFEEWCARAKAWEAENPAPAMCDVDQIEWLEVDHRVPLWEVADLPDEERRWYFGPGNLWLLCGPHHLAKTRREAARRAEIKRLARAQISLPL